MQLNCKVKSGNPPALFSGLSHLSSKIFEKGKLKKVLNVYKENISAAYVSNMEIEEPSPLYVRDTKNKAEEFDRLHATIEEKLVTASNIDFLNTLIVFNSICKRTETKKGDTCKTFQKKDKAMA